MSKVTNENYILIQGFMINELKLKGNELLVYAIIYGFSQLNGQKYTGSLQYLADWTNSTKQGVQKNLKNLLDKNLIVKEDKIINDVKYCEYYATQLYTLCNSVVHPMQLSCTNNIEYNIEDNKKESKKQETEKQYQENIPLENINNKKTSYDEIINNYTDDDKLRIAIHEFIKMRKMKKKPITDRALQMILNKLNGQPINEQIYILDNSIINCWTDVYPKAKKNTEVSTEAPNWINQDIKSQIMSDEEAEELKKELDWFNK